MRKHKSPELRYDPEYDTLEIVLDLVPAVSDELIPGVYIRYSAETEEIVGATILSYSRHDPELVSSKLPFPVDLPPVSALETQAGV